MPFEWHDCCVFFAQKFISLHASLSFMLVSAPLRYTLRVVLVKKNRFYLNLIFCAFLSSPPPTQKLSSLAIANNRHLMKLALDILHGGPISTFLLHLRQYSSHHRLQPQPRIKHLLPHPNPYLRSGRRSKLAAPLKAVLGPHRRYLHRHTYPVQRVLHRYLYLP